MQNVGLVLPDDIIVVKVDAVGINGLCLYRQTVCVVFLRTLASALRLGLSLSTAFIRSLVNISGCLLKSLFSLQVPPAHQHHRRARGLHILQPCL